MKKFFALLVAAAMVVALFAVPAAAEGEVTFAATTVNDANPGDEVTITVSMSGETPYEAHGLNFHLFYDPENLEIVGGSFNGITPLGVMTGFPFGTTVEANTTNVPGMIALGVMCPSTPFTGFGDLFSVNFRVKDTCTTNQELRIEIEQFINSPVEGPTTDIPFVVENGAINLAGEPTTPEPTDVPVTPEPTDVPVTPEPTDVPVTPEPTEVPPEPTLKPTEPPVNPTDEPTPTEPTVPTDAPAQPTDEPTPVNPPHTGTASIVALGVIAIATGAGVVLFRKKEN